MVSLWIEYRWKLAEGEILIIWFQPLGHFLPTVFPNDYDLNCLIILSASTRCRNGINLFLSIGDHRTMEAIHTPSLSCKLFTSHSHKGPFFTEYIGTKYIGIHIIGSYKWRPKVYIQKCQSNNFPFNGDWIKGRWEMNISHQPTTLITRKLRSHIHLYLLSFTSHLISFTSYLFSKSLIELIWLWISM